MKSKRFVALVTVLILIVMLTTVVGINAVSAQSVCSPATPIPVPFSKDGAGTFCYQAATLCGYINSWNVSTLSINGNSYANTWVDGSSIPPLNGVYTITYVGNFAWSHFEIGGTCLGGTSTNTPVPTNTITRTPTPNYTPTRTVTPAGDLGFGSVSGTVTDAITGAPIAGAVVECNHGSIFTPYEEHCNYTATTGADGTYLFDNNIHFYMTDTVTVYVDAAGYGSRMIVVNPIPSANLVVDAPMSLLPTATRTPTPGPSLTPTITPTRTTTLSPTPTLTGGICSPVNQVISAPFVFDGAGTYCWQSNSLGTFIMSFNTSNLSVNGVNLTNMFAMTASLPPQINGYWYISYTGPFPWSHFEAQP